MKFKVLISAGLLAAGLTAAARADDMKITLPGQASTPAASAQPAAAPATAPAPAAQPAAAPAPTFTEQQLVEEFCWFMGKRIGITELEFTPEQIQALVKGLTAAAQAKESPFELDKIGPSMDQFMLRKQQVYMGKLKQKGLADSAAFLTEIKKKAGVVALPSGLCYEIVKPGDGAAPKPTDKVKVHYTGALINGQVFDSSYQHQPPEPAEFQLDQVIPGWTEGLQKISKGGKIRLYVPPQLAYGDDGRPGIPPSSTLIFDVELIDISAGTPAPAAAAPAAAAPVAPATPTK